MRNGARNGWRRPSLINLNPDDVRAKVDHFLAREWSRAHRQKRVDFFRKAHEPSFNEPEIPAGSRTAMPFSVTLSNLPPGHHFVWAVATDNQGATSISVPAMIHVEAAGEEPTIFFRYDGTQVVIDWMPPEAILEEASNLAGPWTPLPNIRPPRPLTPAGRRMFYRVHLP